MNAQPKKIILCDLDGTLLNQRYEMTAPLSDLVTAVTAKQEMGYSIGLNSDTPLLPLQTWARTFGMCGPLLCEKGQLLCVSPEGPVHIYGKMEPFFQRLRQQVMVQAHREIFETFVGVGDVTQFIIDGGGVYGVDRCAVLINGYRQCSFSAYALARQNDKLSTDAELFAKFCDLVFSIIGKDLELLDEPDRNEASGILILHEKGASKSVAVERLFEEFGDDMELVMIGDGNADIIRTGHPIKLCAVANATPSLKAKALETGGIVATKPFAEGVLEILLHL
jgi:hydroxymethylpyrimidine pyrophosphatase-like HAD family hydrolase